MKLRYWFLLIALYLMTVLAVSLGYHYLKDQERDQRRLIIEGIK